MNQQGIIAICHQNVIQNNIFVYMTSLYSLKYTSRFDWHSLTLILFIKYSLDRLKITANDEVYDVSRYGISTRLRINRRFIIELIENKSVFIITRCTDNEFFRY
jgi:hypothetical protein